MTFRNRGLGAALALAVVVGLVLASNAPMAVHPSTDAMLRLAWSARPERIENCRQRSDEELARLPAHMRQPLACEGTTAEYRLQVRVDGSLIVDRVVHGGGLRRDRRLYVFEELPLPPGDVGVGIQFVRLESGDSGAPVAAEPREAAGRGGTVSPARGESIPALLSFERRLHTSPREVVLVTYDSDRRELTAIRSPSRTARW